VAETVPILYREFYDFPRMFVATYRGETFLFDGSFDDELDDYPPRYSVFLLPTMDAAGLTASWARLRDLAIRSCGTIPTDAVTFDPTRRQSISPRVLDQLHACQR
jgi:hypothetical protein